MYPLVKQAGRRAGASRRAPNENAQGGISSSPARAKERNSSMETPLPGVPLNSRRISKVSRDHAMTASAGSAS